MKPIYIFLILLISRPIYAQDVSQNIMDVRVVSIDDAKWLAFTMEDAKALLEMRLDFPKMKSALDLFSASLKIKEKIIIKQGYILKNQKAQLFVLVEENKELRKMLEASQKWYKDPWFIFTAGIIIGGGAVTAIVIGVQ